VTTNRRLCAALAFILFTYNMATAQTTSGVIRVDVTLGETLPEPQIFYIDPLNGSSTGDGSRTKPWRTLEAVFAAKLINGEDRTQGTVHAGDLVYLLSGNHGSITLTSFNGQYNNTSNITITALPNNRPILNQLSLRNVSKWTFRGLTFMPPARASGVPIPAGFTLAAVTQCDSIVLDKNTLYSQPDASAWTPEDWANNAVYRAIAVTGTQCTLTNNVIRNVRSGISVGGSGMNVTSNIVDQFADDAIDFTSSNTVIRANVITNHYGFLDDGVHNDGIQGWTVGGVIGTNILIDRNLVMASTNYYASIPALATGAGEDYMQGISIFDGSWLNVTVTNNVVIVPAFHGISMYGVNSLNIQNNTVLTCCSSPDVIAWIGVFNNKDGTISKNTVVRNNITANLNFGATGVVNDHNIVLTPRKTSSLIAATIAEPVDVFVTYRPDLAAYDLHLAPGSPAICAGGSLITKVDITGKTRVNSDCGAYAY
jgi:hypothetical protein